MGDQRIATCDACGKSVIETWCVGFVDFDDGAGGLTGGIHGMWTKENHLAPCGLQCMGGGLRGREQIRLLRETPPQVHGSSRSPCPRCTPTPPTEREE